MPTPFTATAGLSLPGTPGLPHDPIAFLTQMHYAHKAEFEYNFPSSTGTQAINFGTTPAVGAKAFLLYYEPASGSNPIDIMLNGAQSGIEITAGGMFMFVSPNPAEGVQSISLAYTGAGRVRVWLLG